MRLRVTDDAPAYVSYPYTDRLEAGDEFDVGDEKGAVLLEAHDYLEAVGADDTAALDELTKAKLYDRASEADIAGRSDMTKAELIDALSED